MKNFNQHIKKMAQHLNIGEEQINNLFLDTADDFLKDYAGNASAAQIWKDTPEFWSWWQQIWMNRDNMILKRYPQRITTTNRADLYQVWHSLKFIHHKPNSVVYDSFIRTLKSKNVITNEMA